ncbi:hypothetical protein jhhlp_003142 [Lomentospora prolificans]|uniref:Uncharacterized protein n=1 Tax=Lomentospora prolificans TaxID=41688 RepID=A0A2N3NG08_9PEZI|nr:hypothetical protein jhhlp_003142 [Lomentospora prolificans]
MFTLRYNNLLHPEEALGELFVRHGVQDVFGVHLLHGHFIAPEGTVLLGTEAKLSEQSSACWTKPVLMAELASKAVHGHVFRLLSNGTFVPYELQEGEISSKAASTAPEFFQELALLLRDTMGPFPARVMMSTRRRRTLTVSFKIQSHFLPLRLW